MQIDPALVGPVSMFFGALMGGSASLMAAIYTRRDQNRVESVACEIAKREKVYSEFLMNASNSFLLASVNDDIVLRGDEHRLIGLINQMRLFAPADVVEKAEAVLKAIIETSLKPSVGLRQLATEAMSKNPHPDPLLAFSKVCRADLDDMGRIVA